MTYVPEIPSSEIPAPQAGIMRVGGGTGARAVGPIVVVPFPVVASVANGLDGTTVLARAHVNSTHRVRRVYGAASVVPTETGTFDVYSVGGSPASILHAPVAADAAASAVLTSTGVAPTAGDTVTVGAATYTFVAALTTDPAPVPFEVLIGASAAASLDNLKAAVNAAAGAGTTYGTGTTANADATATTNTDTAQTFVAKSTGAAGNALASTVVSADSVLAFGDETFAGGTDESGAGVLLTAADTVAAADAKDGAPVVGGPATYTLRADTTAASAAFTNLQAYLEVELLS